MHGGDRAGEMVHGGLFVRQPHQANRIIGNDEIIYQEVLAGLSDPPRHGSAGEEGTESSQLGLGLRSEPSTASALGNWVNWEWWLQSFRAKFSLFS